LKTNANPTVINDRYEFVRGIPSRGDVMIALDSIHLDAEKPVDTEVFLAKAVACKIELKIEHKSAGDLASLPLSVLGKTTVNYAGNAPMVVLEPDKFGNLQVRLAAGSVLEVVFNRELPGSHGRNRGAQGKKIVYIS
jgi:hypothetical protein